MKLGDYIRQSPQTAADEALGAVSEKTHAHLRELLYREVPSERIAQLLNQGREHARQELAVCIEQILSAHDFAPMSDIDRPSSSSARSTWCSAWVPSRRCSKMTRLPRSWSTAPLRLLRARRRRMQEQRALRFRRAAASRHRPYRLATRQARRRAVPSRERPPSRRTPRQRRHPSPLDERKHAYHTQVPQALLHA